MTFICLYSEGRRGSLPAGGCSKKSPPPRNNLYAPSSISLNTPRQKAPSVFHNLAAKPTRPSPISPVDFFNAHPLSTPPVYCFKHPPHPANSPPISAPSLFIFSKAYTHYSVVFCAFKKSLLVKTNFASKYRGISPKASFAKNISLQLYT